MTNELEQLPGRTLGVRGIMDPHLKLAGSQSGEAAGNASLFLRRPSQLDSKCWTPVLPGRCPSHATEWPTKCGSRVALIAGPGAFI